MCRKLIYLVSFVLVLALAGRQSTVFYCERTKSRKEGVK